MEDEDSFLRDLALTIFGMSIEEIAAEIVRVSNEDDCICKN